MSWNTHIPKFRRFVLQNFPFIEQDFDALTDYELICKVVEYLNRVITSQNEVVAEVERFETDVYNEIDTFETNITNNFNRLEGLFNDLKSYVDNYFDNLDVQEEINNKLDDMVEAGTLQEIITSYIQANVAWTFDTVADMKAATNLVDGSYARTIGYYSINDGGGSLYKIKDTQPSTHYETLQNSLYAELLVENTMNVMQFGVQNDSENTENTDYTNTIQKALKYGAMNLVFNAGTYTITNGLEVECNVYGSSTGKTTISFPTADPTQTSLSNSIFLIYDQYNIEVSGINFIGSFSDANPGPIDGTSEHAHAFALRNAHDIYIHDCNANKIFGDFAYVGGGRVGDPHEGKSTNVKIENCVVEEIKRMLVSFIHCDKVFTTNCSVTKNHVNVAIFDLEPNNSQQQTTNIVIKNNFIDTAGNCFSVAHGANQNQPQSLVISDNYIKKCSNLFTSSDPRTEENREPYIDNLVLENNYVETIVTAIFGTDCRIRGVKRGIIRGNTVPQEVLIKYSQNLTVEGNKVTDFRIENSKDITVSNNEGKFIRLIASQDLVIANNIMKREEYGYDKNCLFIESGSRYYITNNLFSKTQYAVRIQLSGNADTITLKNNTIITSRYGIYTAASSSYSGTNIDLCDNEVLYNQQDDSSAYTLVVMLDNLNKQYDTSNYFKFTGLDKNTGFNQGLKGQYVKNTNPTLLSDSIGSYYVKGWLCVDESNQTWIVDKLRV